MSDGSLQVRRVRADKATPVLPLLFTLVLALLFFAFAGSALATGVVDQQQPSATGYTYVEATPGPSSQTFTAGHDGPLNKVSVYIGGYAPYTVQAEIWTTSSLLATGTLRVGPGDGWQDITFTSPPTLTAGTQYRLVLRYVDAQYRWWAAGNNPYTGGAAYIWNGSSWFPWPDGYHDWAFKTYYEVVDTTAPVVTAPADVSAEAPNCLGTNVTFAASATDDVDGNLSANSIDYYTDYGAASQAEVHSGDHFPVGTTEVTAAATDSSGNTGTATFTITVVDIGQVVVDQQETLPAEMIAYWNVPTLPANNLYAQTFTAGRSGPLTKVSLYISNSYADNFDVQALLCPWPLSGEPSAEQILATSTAVHFASKNSSSWWQDFTFASPASVTEGSQYVIVLVGAKFGWWEVYDPCFGNETNHEFTGGEWYQGYGENFVFKTYVEATPPIVIAPENPVAEATSPDGAEVTLAAIATDKLGTDISSSIHYYTDYGTASQAEVHSGDTFSLGGTRVTAVATDACSNTGRAVFYVKVRDTIKPVTTSDVANGWQNNDLVTLTPTDEGSGVSHTYYYLDWTSQEEGTSVTVPEGTHTLAFWSVDNAGNSEDWNTVTVQVDKQGPATTSDAPSGWQASDVNVHFTAEDTGGSGVAHTYYTLDDGTQQEGTAAVVGEGTHTLAFWSVDNAGNVEAKHEVTVQVDATAPKITVSTPGEGASYLLNQQVKIDWSAEDLLSGVASCGGAPCGSLLETTTPGAHSITVTSTDNVGHTASKTINYLVIYSYSGILDPINANGQSIFKAGSTVAVKFQLSDADGAPVSTGQATISWAKYTNTILGSDVEATSTAAATSGNLFRYDATSQQYIFNWSTKGLTAGTYRISVDLHDGSAPRTVQLSLK